MPRWEEGSADRLRNVAFELFEEQGFDATTVVLIAARARVTTRTFFRHFSDKQEVLFAHSEELRRQLVEKLHKLPGLQLPLQAVLTLLFEFPWETMGSRLLQRQRQTVITGSPELLERDLRKNHENTESLIEVFIHHGVDPTIARTATRVGVILFTEQYLQWLQLEEEVELSSMKRNALTALRAMLPPDILKQFHSSEL